MAKIVLKVSGEILPLNNIKNSADEFALFIKKLVNDGHQIAIVIGGGNLFRGRAHPEMNEINRDTIGMLASIINAFHINDALMRNGVYSIIATPFELNNLIPKYTDEELIKLYEENVIVFGGGIGKTGVSTDTKVYEVAKLLNIDNVIKLTNIDGIYDSDPKLNPDAKFLSKVSYDEILNNKLNVMDLDVIKNFQKDKINIKVMNYNKKELLFDDKIGSVIGDYNER